MNTNRNVYNDARMCHQSCALGRWWKQAQWYLRTTLKERNSQFISQKMFTSFILITRVIIDFLAAVFSQSVAKFSRLPAAVVNQVQLSQLRGRYHPALQNWRKTWQCWQLSGNVRPEFGHRCVQCPFWGELWTFWRLRLWPKFGYPRYEIISTQLCFCGSV